ncbi:MAG TPA: N-acetylmuramoyl-L-alanine amidase [Candidatus Angelobacter sp.]|nr:N-acetylmuramoyl-L-alanine amidase [Candidatus Angelobacter sp.]
MKAANTIRAAMVASLACALLAPAPAHARSVQQKKQAAAAQLVTAERMREALDGKPESRRTRRDFQKVMDAYRQVYYKAPTYSHADASVLAVAELMEQQGRVLGEPRSFKDAIGQLEFLRREYPGSKYRIEALFTIAQIYRDDLDDAAQARAGYEEFLKHYPHSSIAPKARDALAEMDEEAKGGSNSNNKDKRDRDRDKDKAQSKDRSKDAVASSSSPKNKAASHNSADANADVADAKDPRKEAEKDEKPVTAETQPPDRHTLQLMPLPLMTKIRHWSTPDYTRVAIDLEQEVKYEAGRVPNPDRIFFDLHGIKLAPDLVGKSFEVEDGFLHKIRVAQFKPGLARVVLDVDDVAEYSAFLLPNPYRLIIDIHGKQPASKVAAKQKPPTSAPPSQTKPQPSDTAAGSASATPNTTVAQAKTPENIKPAETKPAPVFMSAGGDSSSAKKIEPAKTEQARFEQVKPEQVKPEQAKTEQLKTESAKTEPAKTEIAASTGASAAVNTAAANAAEDVTIDAADRATARPTSGPTVKTITPHEPPAKKTVPPVQEDRASTSSAHVATPPSSGTQSLTRALGLKIGRIVVDAGHGGHDTGTIGPGGLREKDLVLDVALKLGKLLENRLGAEVVYTRDDDTFIPLETRTAIANKEEADLFISIHANSSQDPAARGIETYYLNFTSSADALEVAARENAVSEKSIHELQDLVRKIALKEKIQESREFAADVQKLLYGGLNAKNPGMRNRGVKKAPFIVLIGANMPSILTEISFISNPGDEKKLRTSEYRQRVAESIYKGIAKYTSGLSGVRVAQKPLHTPEHKVAAAVPAR